MPTARPGASILHLDLDAFFAAVEQRDKPSLRGRPVVVGGTGMRGVVATASYEARAFGARSAMPTAEARRRCPPGTAYLSGRFDAYRAASAVVMELLAEVSPVLEQVSVDEAYLDLTAAGEHDLSPDGLRRLGEQVQRRVQQQTGGLTASVGIGTSKMIAKLGSEARKPGGLTVIAAGEELQFLHPLSVRAVPGVGPATAAKLHSFGVETVGDLAAVTREDLISIFGNAHGVGLYRLARADDDRPVETERPTKSVSAEETYEHDLTDPEQITAELRSLAARVTSRLATTTAGFARTITLKVRRHDFTTLTRSWTLSHATSEADVVTEHAAALLAGVDISGGVRLLGVGVSGFTGHSQSPLWDEAPMPVAAPVLHDDVQSSTTVEEPAGPEGEEGVVDDDAGVAAGATSMVWRTGADIVHAEHGPGWVWGGGLGRVTVRFEGPGTGPGPIRTFAADDPQLSPGSAPVWPQTEAADATSAW